MFMIASIKACGTKPCRIIENFKVIYTPKNAASYRKTGYYRIIFIKMLLTSFKIDKHISFTSL